MAKISVIIPVFGAEKYLEECLESVLAQTFPDLEIIVIDDGSKDKCPEIIDRYARKDGRIKAIHKENGGYGSACNSGLEIASGEYAAIVEPDDFIAPSMYENLYKIAKQNDSDIVKSSFFDNLQFGKKFITKKAIDAPSIPPLPFTIREYPEFLSYHPSIWSCIYKKEFLNKNNIRFIEARGASWTDNLFQVQTLLLAGKINYTDNAFYYWRRLKECPSDSLSDFKIPFLRMNEIHDFLETKNADENILNALYKREINYINIALGAVPVKKYGEIEPLVRNALFRMKNINKSLQKEYGALKNKLFCKMIGIKIKNMRKKFLSIRLQEKRVTFCGKTIVF